MNHKFNWTNCPLINLLLKDLIILNGYHLLNDCLVNVKFLLLMLFQLHKFVVSNLSKLLESFFNLLRNQRCSSLGLAKFSFVFSLLLL